jgi:hypothetical protein
LNKIAHRNGMSLFEFLSTLDRGRASVDDQLGNALAMKA